jgi:DNA mismatch repair protein MutS
MSEPTTPMMAQYRRLRAELPPDTILFFRLGDFYEMFFDDAVEASRLLEITLTRRQKVPMCGVPYHAVQGHLARLLRAGKKVAICEQLEDPAAARGLVRRDVTRIVTPGTVIDEGALDAAQGNYLAGLCRGAGARYGLAMLELSTGAFWIEESERPGVLADVVAKYAPSECLVPGEQAADAGLAAVLAARGGATVTRVDDWTFASDVADEMLRRHFGVHSLDGFGAGGLGAAVGAAGAVLRYVTHDLRRDARHVRRLRVRQSGDFLVLDEATVANLELVAPRGGPRAGGATTLLGVLDVTRTPMGSRMLREWLLRPLADLEGIRARHDAVEGLAGGRPGLAELRERLGEVRDLERLVSRLSSGGGNARDLRAVAGSLAALPGLKAALGPGASPRLCALAAAVAPMPELQARIDRALVDEPPFPVKEGGMIRPGQHPELDRLRGDSTEGRRWLAEFQSAEQERTGIKSLKVRHNKVFGYYIEVTKANLAGVPAHYVRKQTMVNAERFVTPELKEHENRILGAQERAVQLEYELFVELREAVVAETDRLQRTAAALAELDALGALADRALALRYVRPAMTDGDRLRIRDGRHPVIEQLPGAERFVPNDTLLDGDRHRLVILTGPNMAGKSTYIRQVALIAILAHAGSFVPAAEAEIALADRVFTRVGASDDLARGRSTFMVEMQETASILAHATGRSLIVLDEIGRGTSTFDGISIAWAVAEFLHNQPGPKARTLFATHYHELTDLALALPGAKNYNVLVRESGERIAFLRKIAPGAADQSYGIQVARLAGLPPEVIERAKEILANLEEGEFAEAGQPRLAQRRPRRARADERQIPLL